MIILDATTKTLEIATSAAGSVDYVTAFADITTTAFTAGESNGNITTATTTTIVAAPASSTQRQIKNISILNRSSTVSQSIDVKYDSSGTERFLFEANLAPGESMQYSSNEGWKVYYSNGIQKTQGTVAVYSGRPVNCLKVGTAPEAAGQWYGFLKDSGFPGAYTVGSPGLAGRATDGTTATDAGCLVIPNASTGVNYLADLEISSTVAGFLNIFDMLWINSGIVVTTTTAQTINSVAFPARDINGSTNGEGVEVGLYVTATMTNAAITNTTMSYTNSDGTAGRTATIASFVAAANVGTLVIFQLQAGDKGVRSIQSITLGTTYATGTMSLIAFVRLAAKSVMLANSGTTEPSNKSFPGVRLYNGVCALPFVLCTAATAMTINLTAAVVER